MPNSAEIGLYSKYGEYKGYKTPVLKAKQIRRFEKEIWAPAGFSESMSCLEIGSGTGEFLSFLGHKRLATFKGIDLDPNLVCVQPESVRAHFEVCDVWAYLARDDAPRLDRIVMIDVLEHFSADDARLLVAGLLERLARGGKLVVRVPNAASPWGFDYQFGDLTHRTPFTAASLRQLAIASGGQIDKIYPQQQGTRRRRLTDAIVNRLLSWALLTSPEFWSANIYAIFSRVD